MVIDKPCELVLLVTVSSALAVIDPGLTAAALNIAAVNGGGAVLPKKNRASLAKTLAPNLVCDQNEFSSSLWLILDLQHLCTKAKIAALISGAILIANETNEKIANTAKIAGKTWNSV